jgi:hypothetical protein
VGQWRARWWYRAVAVIVLAKPDGPTSDRGHGRRSNEIRVTTVRRVGERVMIAGRFNGPPTSGHGGYSCGVAGRLVRGDTAEVKLRRPPPLETPLDVVRIEDAVRLLDGDEVVVEARPALDAIDLPVPVSLAVATQAALPASEIVDHPFPSCFGCGPDRPLADGLELFPGFVDERRSHVACPLVFDRSLCDATGVVNPEVVWAALDCPSGWAFHGGDMGQVLNELGTFVTGTIAASIPEQLHVDQTYVIMGWPIGRDGRKLYSGSAIFTEDGAPLAWCRQTWIIVRTPVPRST